MVGAATRLPGSKPTDAGLTAAARRRLPRVLCATALDPSQKFGSLEEQTFLLARAFRDRGGVFVPLYLKPGGAAVEEAYHGAELAVEALDLRTFSWANLRNLLALVRRHRIELIHWNFYPPLGNCYVWALTLLAPRLRHCSTDHNSRLGGPPPTRFGRFVKQVLFRRYQQVVGVSQFVVESLRTHGLGANLRCCRHFINTDRFCPDSEVRERVRRELDAADQFVALIVCNLIAAKGVDVALRAVAELPPNVTLWVAGGGPERDNLEALAGHLGVRDRVRFLGLRDRVESFLQAADCAVCPSLWQEAAGLVNIEAQACGLPVAASRIGGIPEYVADGITGLLFPPGDHHELARCLRELCDDRDRRRRLGTAARQRAVECFSPAARLDDFLNIYPTIPL